MAMDDPFLVQFILNLLPSKYETFQFNYNTIKNKWDVNELIGKLIQEENRLRNLGSHTVNFTIQGVGKALKPKFKKFKKKKGPIKAFQTEKME